MVIWAGAALLGRMCGSLLTRRGGGGGSGQHMVHLQITCIDLDSESIHQSYIAIQLCCNCGLVTRVEEGCGECLQRGVWRTHLLFSRAH